ncbi:MAG: TIGR03808 family TAT-translocated repetitive protein [Pseudolabrys sp.]
MDRRQFLTATGILAVAAPAQAAPQALPPGHDATRYGVRPGASDDQSRALQKAIDRVAAANAPLVLPSGTYRCADLKLPPGAVLAGVRGATKLVLSRPAPLLTANRADRISLTGLGLDGNGIKSDTALVQLANGSNVHIADCEFSRAGGNALALETIAGDVVQCSFTDIGNVALFSRDSRGLTIARNAIKGCGNGGIYVWQSEKRPDNTIVADNRIEDVAARAGGSGQNGNAINVFRAANVIVRGNRIDKAAFSAVRGNAANNLQVHGNVCTSIGEVALYAEFDFEGAVIVGNSVDGAALGIAVTNFNQGGRLAAVHGNLIRNLVDKRPAGTDPGDSAGLGIGVEADTAVTGNTIENAPLAGIMVGWGKYQRDIAVSGNVIRNAGYGITVSVSAGAGQAAITGNMIAGARRGGIVGMDERRVATGDLASGKAGAANLTVTANRLR